MTVIADTGPIQYLILIDRIELLRAFFDTVVLPVAVLRELDQATTPAKVLYWIREPPDWMMVREAEILVEAPKRLGPGEVAAISLAVQLDGTLLIDDRDGWKLGGSHGLARIGTLGVPIEAHAEGLDSIRDAVERLQQTSFHASPALFDQVVEVAERRRNER